MFVTDNIIWLVIRGIFISLRTLTGKIDKMHPLKSSFMANSMECKINIMLTWANQTV